MNVSDVRSRLLEGLVIPAHPFAVTENRTLDERSQRGITRYYCESGAGGIAVGVHTTQFAIREHGLFKWSFLMREHDALHPRPLPNRRPVPARARC